MLIFNWINSEINRVLMLEFQRDKTSYSVTSGSQFNIANYTLRRTQANSENIRPCNVKIAFIIHPSRCL